MMMFAGLIVQSADLSVQVAADARAGGKEEADSVWSAQHVGRIEWFAVLVDQFKSIDVRQVFPRYVFEHGSRDIVAMVSMSSHRHGGVLAGGLPSNDRSACCHQQP